LPCYDFQRGHVTPLTKRAGAYDTKQHMNTEQHEHQTAYEHRTVYLH